jgi:hypothetical protein
MPQVQSILRIKPQKIAGFSPLMPESNTEKSWVLPTDATSAVILQVKHQQIAGLAPLMPQVQSILRIKPQKIAGLAPCTDVSSAVILELQCI